MPNQTNEGIQRGEDFRNVYYCPNKHLRGQILNLVYICALSSVLETVIMGDGTYMYW